MKENKNKNWETIIILLLILIVGTIFRFYTIGARGLWIDEAASVYTAKKSLPVIVKELSSQNNLPFFYLLLHFWMKIFGNSEFSVRFPSFIFGVLSILLIFYYGKKMFSIESGLWAAFLLAISPFHIYYSQEARWYTLLPLLTLTSTFFLYEAIKTGNLCSIFIFILSTSFSLYTHPYAYSFMMVFGLYILFAKGKLSFIKRILLLLLPVIIFLPWTKILIAQISHSKEGLYTIQSLWLKYPPKFAILRTFQLFMTGMKVNNLTIPIGSLDNFQFTIFLFYFISFISAFVKTEQSLNPKINIDRIKTYLLLALFIPLLIPFLWSHIKQPIYFVGRYDIVALPIFCLIIGAGIPRITKNGNIIVIIGTFLFFISLISTIPYYKSNRKSFEKLIMMEIIQHLENGDYIVFTGLSRASGEYYLEREGKKLKILSFPEELKLHPATLYPKKFNSMPEKMKKEAENIIKLVSYNMPPENSLWVLLTGPEVRLILLNELMKSKELSQTQRIIKPNMQIMVYRKKGYENYKKKITLSDVLNREFKNCDSIIFSSLSKKTLHKIKTVLKPEVKHTIFSPRHFVDLSNQIYLNDTLKKTFSEAVRKTGTGCNLWLITNKSNQSNQLLLREGQRIGQINFKGEYKENTTEEILLYKFLYNKRNPFQIVSTTPMPDFSVRRPILSAKDLPDWRRASINNQPLQQQRQQQLHQQRDLYYQQQQRQALYQKQQQYHQQYQRQYQRQYQQQYQQRQPARPQPIRQYNIPQSKSHFNQQNLSRRQSPVSIQMGEGDSIKKFTQIVSMRTNQQDIIVFSLGLQDVVNKINNNIKNTKSLKYIEIKNQNVKTVVKEISEIATSDTSIWFISLETEQFINVNFKQDLTKSGFRLIGSISGRNFSGRQATVYRRIDNQNEK